MVPFFFLIFFCGRSSLCVFLVNFFLYYLVLSIKNVLVVGVGVVVGVGLYLFLMFLDDACIR